MEKISAKKIPKKKLDEEKKIEALDILRKRQLINVSLSLILALIIFFGISIIYLNSVEIRITDKTPSLFRKAVEINNAFFPKPQKPAAVVNNEIISIKELDDRYNLVPDEYKTLVSKEQVLLQMIDEKLLIQQANQMNIQVSDQETQDELNYLMNQSQITREEFEQAVRSKNLTIAQVEDFYKKEILLNKLLNATILSKISVSDTDIKDYYFRNPDKFMIPESVNVSHILICHNESLRCKSNLTKEEAFEKAKEIRLMVNSTNFGQLAYKYSDEPAAVVTHGNLGWVSIEDPFDRTFMNATFNLTQGQVSEPVETIFGYHIIKVFDKRKAGLMEIKTVYDQINKTIAAQLQQENYAKYISGLRNESEIINYLEKN